MGLRVPFSMLIVLSAVFMWYTIFSWYLETLKKNIPNLDNGPLITMNGVEYTYVIIANLRRAVIKLLYF